MTTQHERFVELVSKDEVMESLASILKEGKAMRWRCPVNRNDNLKNIEAATNTTFGDEIMK